VGRQGKKKLTEFLKKKGGKNKNRTSFGKRLQNRVGSALWVQEENSGVQSLGEAETRV